MNAPSEARPRRILVVANETVGGKALIEAVKAHADAGPTEVTVICPQNRPKAGLVVYDESVQMAAENRLKTTLEQLRAVGIQAEGEVMDPDPYSAVMDAVGHFGADEIIISTFPETRSGWLRRDLIDRVRHDTDLPVEHVVVDFEADKADFTNILVVGNETITGKSLIEFLKRRAEQEGPPLRFIVVCPQGGNADAETPKRLAKTLEKLHAEGWEAEGQVMDPDPFTAVQNALQFYSVDEIVISTFPETRSGWLRSDLISRLRSATTKPIEHVVVTADEAREGAAA